VVFSVGFFNFVPLWIVAKATSQRQENFCKNDMFAPVLVARLDSR